MHASQPLEVHKCNAASCLPAQVLERAGVESHTAAALLTSAVGGSKVGPRRACCCHWAALKGCCCVTPGVFLLIASLLPK